MFQTNIVEKIKKQIVFSMALRDKVEKYGTARQATGDSTTRRMRFACWLTKVTDDPFGSSIIQRGGE
jgi:hypothetical protein